MDSQLNTQLNLLNLNESKNTKSIFKKDENDHELMLEQNKLFKFDPPLYLQRYDYVCELIRKYKCRTFMDVGAAECKMLRYLKNTTTELNLIIGLDIDDAKLDYEKEKFSISWFDHIQPKLEPTELYLISGDITQSDDYFTHLLRSINLDFVSLVELIEHLEPELVNKCIHTVFNLIKPKFVLITTPNKDFNILFGNNLKFRHWDHKFEWTREQFQDFCQNEILNSYSDYELLFYDGLGQPPQDHSSLGHCTQLGLFKLKYLPKFDTKFDEYLHSLKKANYINRNQEESSRIHLDPLIEATKLTKYKLVSFTRYPFDTFEFENIEQRNQALLCEINYLISFLCQPSCLSPRNSSETPELTEEQKEKLENLIDLDDEKIRIASIDKLISFNSIQKFKLTKQEIIDLMIREGYEFTSSGNYVFEMNHVNDESISSYYSNYEYNDYETSNKSFKVDEEDWDKDIETSCHANAFEEEDWDIEMMNSSAHAAASNKCKNQELNSGQISYNDNKICGPFDQFEDAQYEKDNNNNYLTDAKFHGKIYECIANNLNKLNISSRFEINYNDSERKKLSLEFKSIRRKHYKEFKKKTFDLNIVPSQFEESSY